MRRVSSAPLICFAAFLRATSVWAVGSIQAVASGRHGQPRNFRSWPVGDSGDHGEEPGKESRFGTGGGDQPIDPFAERGVVNFVGAVEGDRQCRGPMRFWNVSVGLPSAVFALPGAKEPPAFLPRWRLAIFLQGEEGIGGRFEPGAFAREITPTAIRVLVATESLKTGAEIAFGHIYCIGRRPEEL